MSPVSVDQLAAFLKQRPPRSVPSVIKRKALKGGIFGVILFGLIFSGMGVPFLYIFFPWRLLDELSLNTSGTTTEGIVTGKEETNMNENDRRVYRYRFSFIDNTGNHGDGVCYKTGSGFKKADKVKVQYLDSDPSICRIEKCRLSPFGWGAGFVIIFPLVGILVLFFAIRARSRKMQLLRSGLFSTGRIESVDITNVTVNNQRRYKVTVSFDDAAGRDHSTSYGAYGHDVTLATQKQQENATVGLLYHPTNPKRILLVDTLLS